MSFPRGQRVAFEAPMRELRVYQQIWVLEGTIDITIGDERHRLREGDPRLSEAASEVIESMIEPADRLTDAQVGDLMRLHESMLIRRTTLADLRVITEIYNEAILTTIATFDNEPKTVEERVDWFHSHDDRHPVLVAVLAEQVVGWACLSKWSDRQAYSDTGETSFYVKSEFRGRGIGRRLKQATIAEARRLGFHTIIARVAEGSDASLHLNLSSGFVHVGTLREVGRKFGRLLDVHVLQKMLD